MQTPWLQHYPPGVPAQANIDAYRSLAQLLEAAFQRHPSRDALACMDSRLTFRQVDELSQALGAWLQSLKLERGSRVAVMMPNVPQYLVAIAAILRAGYVVVNVNPLYTARELEHQLTDSGSQAVIVLENFAHTLEECIDQTPVRHVVLAAMGDMLGFWRGRWINFAVRHLKRMVPEFSLPLDEGRTVTHFNDALTDGAGMSLRQVDIGPDDVPNCIFDCVWLSQAAAEWLKGKQRFEIDGVTGRLRVDPALVGRVERLPTMAVFVDGKAERRDVMR